MEALVAWRRLTNQWAAGGADPTHWHVVILNEGGGVLAKVPSPVDLADWARVWCTPSYLRPSISDLLVRACACPAYPALSTSS